MATIHTVKKPQAAPFDEAEFEKWVQTKKAQILMGRIDSIMAKSETPFDGTMACLKILGIKPSFNILCALTIIGDHTQKYLAKEERSKRRRQNKMGIHVGDKVKLVD